MRLRGCGDGKRGDSEAEVGRGGSFFGTVSPIRVHQATRADLKKKCLAVLKPEYGYRNTWHLEHGRKNCWGVINVEDERHCEFVYLRNFLTRYIHASPG